MPKNTRGSKYSKAQNEVLNAFDYGIDEALLNAFCSYTMSQNSNIHKYGLTSLAKLVANLNEASFTKNQKMLIKFRFLNIALQIRLDGLSNRELLLSAINRQMDINSLVTEEGFLRELSNEEIVYVEKTIASFMNNNYLTSHITKWMNLCEAYRTGSYREKENALPQIRDCMAAALTQFRKNDMAKESATNTFRLSSMNQSIEDIHKYITSPSYKLVTGMQGLNAMLGGGFEKAREYMFLALSGEGKTVTLENLFYQVWKNNKGFKTMDPTKKPAIVYLTMENFVVELVASLYHIITRGGEMKECSTPQEALEEFQKAKFMYSGDEDEIELVIKFKPVNSVDTSYLYQITEELEDEGFECICFFQDYLMRILPSVISHDQYKDFGTIANDFKTFATLKQVPIISASQLNREAAKIIDEGRGKNDPNLVKKLGRANAGDSVNIERNVDGMFILVPEQSASGEKYMGIKNVKHRYKTYTNVNSIYQPYYPNTDIALVEDLYETQPAYKLNLARDEEEIRAQFGLASQNNMSQIANVANALRNISSNTNSMMQQGFSNIPTNPQELPRNVEPKIDDSPNYSFNIANSVEPKEDLQVVTILKTEDIEKNREKYIHGGFYQNI